MCWREKGEEEEEKQQNLRVGNDLAVGEKPAGVQVHMGNDYLPR